MIPPDFVRFQEGKGLDRAYRNQCVHFPNEVVTSRGLLWKHRDYVPLFSSCSNYGKKVNLATPIFGKEDIKAKFRFGLDDLLKLT